MTPSRLFAAAMIVGLVAMVSSLSLHSGREADSSSRDPLARAVRQLASATGDAQAAVHAYRVMQALDRWRHSSGSDSTFQTARFDRDVPRAVVEPLRSALEEHWSRLGRTTVRNAEFFVFVDSSIIPRADSATTVRRSIELPRLVDISYAPPESTDGQRCVVLVRLRGITPAHVAAAQAESLPGICGFYGVFGLPGAGVRSWLSATGHAFARQSDWYVARAPSIDAASIYALGPEAARCLTGASDSCRVALGMMSGPQARGAGQHDASVPERVLDAVTTTRGRQRQQIGEFQGRYLADVVRDLGPQRFARFWEADASVDTAFAAVAGVDVATWTEGWLSRTYGAPASRPSVRARDVIWLVAAAPLLLVVAARPRERLLVEALRRHR